MKRNKLFLIPMVAGAVLVSANLASAHGMLGGFGWVGGQMTAEEMASRHQVMFQEQAGLLGVSVDAASANENAVANFSG